MGNKSKFVTHEELDTILASMDERILDTIRAEERRKVHNLIDQILLGPPVRRLDHAGQLSQKASVETS